MEDFSFKTTPALLSNLGRLAKEYSVIGEQRLLELSDIAHFVAIVSRELLNDGITVYEMLSLISQSINFGSYRLSELNSDDNSEILSVGLTTLSKMDRAVFSELYVSSLEELGVRISECDFLEERKMDEMFTYVKNPFSDEAYDVFSQEFADPRLRYSSSFKECVASVESGEVTYCLLPLEERGGVRLPSVAELIYRNDLKINSVTPVFGPDGTADMKYALVSKHFTVPSRKKGDDRYIEIRIGTHNAGPLCDLLLALDYFAMSVYRINTISFETEGESETFYSLVLRDGNDGFVRLLTYLTLFCDDFVPVGIYKNLE